MKKLLLFFIVACQTLTAQDFDWIIKHEPVNSSSLSTVEGICSDAPGNVYLTGYFMGTVDFDPDTGIQSSTTNGMGMFMQKFKPDGQLEWAHRFTGNGTVIGETIKCYNNRIYTSGLYHQTVDFDPGPGVTNINASLNSDAFICKYSTGGSFIWAKSLGDSAGVSPSNVFCDASGNVISGGHFVYRGDFDPGSSDYYLTPAGPPGNFEIYISKLDSNGNFVWAKSFPGVGGELMDVMEMDENGNIFLCVSFSTSFDADPGPGTTIMSTTSPTFATAIIKLDSNGNFLWARKFGEGSAGSLTCRSITVSPSGAIAIGGYLEGDADFDPSAGILMHYSQGRKDGFVLKLHPNGDLDYSIFYGLQGAYAMVSYCQFDANEQLYICGNFYDSVYAGTQFYTADTSGIFLLKTDTGGQTLWQGAMRGFTNCIAASQTAYLSPGGAWYIGGEVKGQLDADPGSSTFMTSTTYRSGFAVKITGMDGSPETVSEKDLLIYPNPSDGMFTIDFNNTFPASDVIINVRDVSGRVVLSAAGQTGSTEQLDLRSFASGFYTVEITGGSIKHVTKLIKQ